MIKSIYDTSLSILIVTSLFAVFVGCSSNKKNESKSSSEVGASEEALPSLAMARVSFAKNKKEMASMNVEDNTTGIRATFVSKTLKKGSYSLQIVDQCNPLAKQKDKAIKANEKIKIGDFATESGDTSSEFFVAEVSVGDRFKSIQDKFIVLNMKNKNGRLTQISCASVTPSDQSSSSQ